MTEETKRPTVTIGCGIVQGLQMRLMDPAHGGIVVLKPGANANIDKDFVDQWRAQNPGFTGLSQLTFTDDPGFTGLSPAPAVDELRQDGPTVQEWVDAGYNPHAYPPGGLASKSTPEEITAAIYAWDQAQAEKAKADADAEKAKEAETASSGDQTFPADAGSEGAGSEGGTDKQPPADSAPAETTGTTEPPADEASHEAPEGEEKAL